jgi:hypothetical protein
VVGEPARLDLPEAAGVTARAHGCVEDRSQAEHDRLADVERRLGVASTSMCRDLGPRPHKPLLGG